VTDRAALLRCMVIGDIIGKPGRQAVTHALPELRRELDLDMVIANGENLAAGAGLTPSLSEELLGNGVDVITSGNHIWDKREVYDYLDSDRPVLRPMNYPDDAPGRGWLVHVLPDGAQVAVMNAMGRVFMNQLDSPFSAMDALLDGAAEPLPPVRILDFHCEITSEKNAMGWVLDGRVTAVVGTHTHVPTADAQILPGGTGYITDIGMTGDYDSVIGMDKALSLQRWQTSTPTKRLEPATAEATLCAVFLETDDATGLARRLEPIRLRGRLAPAFPAELGPG
jgi:2',3'-cyclic-nucleotide 2'-phosphodiesterase